MRHQWIVISSIFFTCLLGGYPTASAQDQGLQDAKNYFDEGQNLYLQGKYQEASAQFMNAYNVKKFPAFLFNVAVCHEKNRDFIKALEFYERYMKEDASTQDKPLVTKRIAGIRKHLNPKDPSQATSQPAGDAAPNLPPVQTKGIVVIESNPEGAAIYLNDKKKGIFTRTPYTGSLPPGKHTIILEMRKFKPERKTFSVRNDRMAYLYFSLSAEEYLGWIEVKANVPGANVYFDKKAVGAVGRTPYTGFLRPGKRKLIVERPGYATYSKDLDITAGKDHVLNVTLKKVDFGWLRVTGKTTKGATILVNGKPIKCEEHPCKKQLPAGDYKVQLERHGFKTFVEDLSIVNAAETQLAVKLNPRPSRVKAYVTFGVSTAFTIGAIITGVMSNSHYDSIQQDLDNGSIFQSADSRVTSGKVTAIISNSLWGLTAITAGLGVYYFFRDVGPASYGEVKSTKIAITPALSPQMAGVLGKVRF